MFCQSRPKRFGWVLAVHQRTLTDVNLLGRYEMKLTPKQRAAKKSVALIARAKMEKTHLLTEAPVQVLANSANRRERDTHRMGYVNKAGLVFLPPKRAHFGWWEKKMMKLGYSFA